MNRSVSRPSTLCKHAIDYHPNVGLMMDTGNAEEELNPPYIRPSRSITQSPHLHHSQQPDMMVAVCVDSC